MVATHTGAGMSWPVCTSPKGMTAAGDRSHRDGKKKEVREEEMEEVAEGEKENEEEELGIGERGQSVNRQDKKTGLSLPAARPSR